MRVLKFDHSNFFLRDNLRLTLVRAQTRCSSLPSSFNMQRLLMQKTLHGAARPFTNAD